MMLESLAGRNKWLKPARLWRLILLQHEDGFFDDTSGLAIALLAAKVRPAPPAPPHVGLLAMVPKPVLAVVKPMWDAWFDAGGDDEGGDGDGGDGGDEEAGGESGDEGEEEEEETVAGRAARALARDCAISDYSAAAIGWSMPGALRELDDGPTDEEEGLDAHRVWATCLALAAMESLDYGWLPEEEQARWRPQWHPRWHSMQHCLRVSCGRAPLWGSA